MTNKLVIGDLHFPIDDLEIVDHGNRLVDALGDRLRRREEETMLGTFSNPAVPAAAPSLNSIMAAFNSLSEPPLERAEFGEVSLALFWTRLQSVKATPLEGGKVEIEVKSIVPDRDNGQLLGISFKMNVPGAEWARPAARAQWLRYVLLAWLTHELDEHLFLEGKRARDPHAPPPFPEPSFGDPGLDFQYLIGRGLR